MSDEGEPIALVTADDLSRVDDEEGALLEPPILLPAAIVAHPDVDLRSLAESHVVKWLTEEGGATRARGIIVQGAARVEGVLPISALEDYLAHGAYDSQLRAGGGLGGGIGRLYAWKQCQFALAAGPPPILCARLNKMTSNPQTCVNPNPVHDVV